MAAGETVIYDLRKIRDQQIPDGSGHTIPLSVTGGQFKWFIHGHGSGRLIGRAEMLSLSEGVSSSYSCPGSSCPPQFSYAYLSPSNIYLGPGDTAVVRVLEVDCDEFFNCIGPFYALVSSWQVTDPYGAVLYYDNGDNLELVGFNGGTAYIRANFGYERYYWEEFTSSCQDEGWDDSGHADGQATVPKVDLRLNGNTVTGQTVNVIVGQEINLTTSVYPSSGTVTDSQWTVPGGNSERIANYVVTFTDNQHPTSATVTNLTALNNSSVDFYWISGGSGRTVQYSAKVNGKSVHPQVTFNVQRPTASITATTSSTNIGVDSQSHLTELRLGNPDSTPGVTFTRSIGLPSGFDGSCEWVQVFSQKSASLTATNGQVASITTAGLDDVYPYPLDPGATQTNFKTSDTPGLTIDGFIAGSVDFRATMWLLFQPSGTPGNKIWVPLRQVSWIWQASATFNGSAWTIASYTDPANPSDANSTVHPVWTTNADTGH